MSLATWLARNKCSGMLFPPPPPSLPLLSFQVCLYSLYRFCLSFIYCKPALCRQVNHPETPRSHWMSVHITGISEWKGPSGTETSLGALRGPRWLCQLQALPGLFWVSWFQSKFPWQLLGPALGWGLGKWRHWENKTIVTESVKMLKRHRLYHYLQKTSSWSLYFSDLSIF